MPVSDTGSWPESPHPGQVQGRARGSPPSRQDHRRSDTWHSVSSRMRSCQEQGASSQPSPHPQQDTPPLAPTTRRTHTDPRHTPAGAKLQSWGSCPCRSIPQSTQQPVTGAGQSVTHMSLSLKMTGRPWRVGKGAAVTTSGQGWLLVPAGKTQTESHSRWNTHFLLALSAPMTPKGHSHSRSPPAWDQKDWGEAVIGTPGPPGLAAQCGLQPGITAP